MLVRSCVFTAALARTICLGSLVLFLTACGGGGGGGGDPGTPPPSGVAAPVIAIHPVSQSVKAGAEITFAASATGEGALAYQWQRNGVDLPGATAAQHTIVTQEADNGTVWTVKVTNASPFAAVSQGATLTVNTADPGITVLAGDVRGAVVFRGTELRDGTGSSARFQRIQGLAVDKVGNVYVRDSGTVRKISPNGVTTTLAGAADQYGTTDGTGSAARFTDTFGIAVDNAGNLYVTDLSAIRKISPAGVVSTLATGERGFSPVVDSVGNLYMQTTIGQTVNFRSTTVRKVTPSGATSVLRQGYDEPGYFNGGGALAVDAQDRVYSTGCNVGNVNTITQFNAQGDVLQVLPAGRCTSLLAMNARGDLYGSDESVVWKREANGSATTIAGQLNGQTYTLGALPGSLGRIHAMAFGPDGSLYAAVPVGVVQIRLP
jgi:hypothetical protein